MGNQRLIGFALVLILVVGATTYLRNRIQPSSSSTLRICAWSNYLPESSLIAFTQKTGIRVEVSYISSNEELFSKLKAGASGFDIIQPSDYMVRQMSSVGMLAPLRHELLSNLKYLDSYYRNLPYDPGLKHSVPFTWGTTGIAINIDNVPLPEKGVSWKTLFQSPDLKRTSLLDDMREVFSAALLSMGFSPNTKNISELQKARAEIARVKERILMFTSEPKALLLRGEISVAHIYSTDAIQARVENPKIHYFIPSEGATLWADSFAIPKSTKHAAQAHQFINYFLDPENARPIFEQNRLATPSSLVRSRLPASEAQDPNLYPPKHILDKMFFLQDIGETLRVVNRMWTELKS